MNKKYVATGLLSCALLLSNTTLSMAASTSDVLEFEKGTTQQNIVDSTAEKVVLKDTSLGEILFQRYEKSLDMCIQPAYDRIRVKPGSVDAKKVRSIQVKDRVLSFNSISDYSMDKNNYNEIIAGTDGPDKFDLGPGDDVVYGGKGNDILIGGIGSDTFVFNGDFDSDTVFDRSVGLYRSDDINTLVFGDLKTTEVTITRDGSSLILKSTLNKANVVTVSGFFAGDNPIQKIDFADTSVNVDKIRKDFE